MPHERDSTIDTLVAQGIELLQAGDSAAARELLSQAVVFDPRNEKAWLWLAGAVETDKERRICLSHVVALNPYNAVAQRGLERLEAALVAPEAAPEEDALAATLPNETSPPRLKRLSVQGPRFDPVAHAEPTTTPARKVFSREMLYWPESERPRKHVWIALVLGIVLVIFGTYAVLHSLHLVGALVLLG